MKRTALITAVLAAGALVLVGCSGDSTDASGDDATSVGGMATCDEATLTNALDELLASAPDGETLISLDGFECADGWAVTFPTVGMSPDDQEGAYTYTQVFRAEGQFWIPVTDRSTVCGTTDVEDPSAYPSDSQVPKSLWQPACNTN